MSEPTPSLRAVSALLLKYRRRKAFAAALRAAWALCALHLLSLSVLGWMSVRAPLSPFWLKAVACSYAAYLIVPLAYWLGWRAKGNSLAAAAANLDRNNPGAPDPFRSSLSLQNHEPRTLARLDRIFESWLPKLALPRPGFFPFPLRAALVAAVVALTAAAWGSRQPGAFLARVATPLHVLNTLPILRFDLGEADRIVGAGDTVKVRGHLQGALPGQTIFAHLRSAAGEKRYPLSFSDGKLSFDYGPAESDFSLQFAADNGRSPRLRFRVRPAPFLVKVQAILRPPGYTRLKPDTLPSGVAHFAVLPGTRVSWLLEADRDLRGLIWSFWNAADGAGRDTALRRVDTLGPGREFRVDREIRSAAAASYRMEDGDGIRSRPSPPLRVDLIEDRPPEVSLLFPDGDGVLDRNPRLPLIARVKDDFGISSLKLAYSVSRAGGGKAEGRRDCRDWLAGIRSGIVEGVWDLSGLELRPGDVLEFHLAAADNDTVSGPKESRSESRSLRFPSMEEFLAISRRSEEGAAANLKSAIQREKQLQRRWERESQTSPGRDAPPLLQESEINKIMVEDPRSQLRNLESFLAGPEKADGELRDQLKKNEASLPRGNQGELPPEERLQNLERLTVSQRELDKKLSALLDKRPQAADAGTPKQRLEEAARELRRNIENQGDLRKRLVEEAQQARARSDQLDQAIQERMRMADDVRAAEDDLEKVMEQGRRNGALSPELLEKMNKVRELLREILPDSVQEMMQRKLAGQEVNTQELRDQLKKLMDQQESLGENLNRAMAMLEQLRDRKRLEELNRALNGMEERQNAIGAEAEAGKAGAAEETEQRSVREGTQKAISEFSSQAGRSPEMRALSRMLQDEKVERDMEAAREGLSKRSPAGQNQAASASKTAAQKLRKMSQGLETAMAAMGSSIDAEEAEELLRETLALSRLQLLIRSAASRRIAEGWEGDEPALYASASQTAQWLNERVRVFSAKTPFVGSAAAAEARGMAAAAHETAEGYSQAAGENFLKRTQNLARELLKLIKLAQSGSSSGEDGEGEGQTSSDGSSGAGKSRGNKPGGDLAGQLKGMSGKQMAVNQATFQLLQAMLEGRRPASGAGQGQGSGQGQTQGSDPGGVQGGGQTPSGAGSGLLSGRGGSPGAGGGGGLEGDGSFQGLGNRQGELGEQLESMAEGSGEEGGAAQKLRKLAEEARKLEEDLRRGRITPEELRQKQERFQSRLLEAANSMEERGMSEKREAEAAHGGYSPSANLEKAPPEGKLLELSRRARKNAEALRLSDPSRKYLDEYYESLLTQ